MDDCTSQCLICERKCKIKEGKYGHCGTRTNINGEIFTIVYGCKAAISNNPIEKKPLYHFHPGSKALTLGTYGCNFDCFWCQNHDLSHPEQKINQFVNDKCEFISPEDFVDLAIQKGSQGISISFNEPTLLFEYSLEAFRIARQKGLYNTYVSNGYMTEPVITDLIKAGLDAINIDIKGSHEMLKRYCDVDNEIIWRNAKKAKSFDIHVEITTLIIEGFNSDKKIVEGIAKRIKDELGEDTPYHLSRFFPRYKSNDYELYKPTKLSIMYQSYEIAKSTGLHYVYLGNIANKKYLQTICPSCLTSVINRNNHYDIEEMNLNNTGNCLVCGHHVCML